LLAYERNEKIMTKLKRENKVIVSELSKEFNVSEETIRRDLKKLEENNLITRIHGGAIAKKRINQDIPYKRRNTINKSEKVEIAKKIVPYFQNATSIIADTSSTVFELLYRLNKTSKGITVITNSIDVLYSLRSSNFNLISTGGTLRDQSFSLVGNITIKNLDNFIVDYGIFSCKAISLTNGIMDSNEPEAVIKRTMANQAKKIILLADFTKFDNDAFVKVFDLKDIDVLVTNQRPSIEWIEMCKKLDITLIF
jgi:DeoR/GlpR family transcriptional regulator of sugar metabolism